MFADVFSDQEQVKEIFDMSCRGAKPGADKITSKQFEENFLENCEKIRDRIARGKYKFTRFEMFLKPKRHYQKPRLIFKSTIRDRFVAKVMNEYLLEMYRKQGYVPCKSIDAVLESLAGSLKQTSNGEYSYRYFLRLDISSYYDSINRELLYKKLEKDKVDEDFLFLVRKLCFNMDKSMDKPDGRGLPQGISVSSILAERYLKEFDELYGSRKEEAVVLRYVDDILILARDLSVYNKVRKNVIFSLCSEYGLNLNSDKIESGKIDELSFEFLGVKVKERQLSISERQLKRITCKLAELFKWYKRNSKNNSYPLNGMSDERRVRILLEKLNLLITGYIYTKRNAGVKSKYGWVLTSLPKHLDNVDELKRLDGFINHLIECYVDVDKKDKDILLQGKKSFYQTYLHDNFTGNKGGYILDREEVKKDEETMYRITCNLSMVDIKRGLDYHNYDEKEFKDKVKEDLYSYFCKTLYIASRELAEGMLYW